MKENYKLALTLPAGAALGATRNFLILALAPIVLITAVALSTPAAATDTREAIRACDANPNCGYSCGGSNCQNITLCVKGGSCVTCPGGGQKGDCVAATRKAPKGGKGKVGTVIGILQSPGTKIPPKGATGLSTVKTGGEKQTNTNNQPMQKEHSSSGSKH